MHVIPYESGSGYSHEGTVGPWPEESRPQLFASPLPGVCPAVGLVGEQVTGRCHLDSSCGLCVIPKGRCSPFLSFTVPDFHPLLKPRGDWKAGAMAGLQGQGRFSGVNVERQGLSREALRVQPVVGGERSMSLEVDDEMASGTRALTHLRCSPAARQQP